MIKLKTLDQAKVEDRRVLLRVDYDTPTTQENGRVVVRDDTRIRLTLPTLEYLLERRCRVVILAKRGRPDGKVVEELRLDPMAKKLEELLQKPVKKINTLIGQEAQQAVDDLQPGEVLMLENTRFHPGEVKNDSELARALAQFGDLIVNDAFSLSHRAHASVSGIAEHLPMVAGLHLQREVKTLSGLVENPKRPFVTIVGGAKISDKVEVIRRLSQLADVVLVGGGVANNFLKAEGIEIYHSYLEDQVVDEAKRGQSFVAVAEELLQNNKHERMMFEGYIPLPRILYPIDVVAADRAEQPSYREVIDLVNNHQQIPSKDDYMFLDIGPKTQRLYRDIIMQAQTVFWNGPMGVFEQPDFAEGTQAVATAMAKTSARTIVGGGDTISALKNFELLDRFDYVSAAGGASLELLSGKTLPGLKPMIEEN